MYVQIKIEVTNKVQDTQSKSVEQVLNSRITEAKLILEALSDEIDRGTTMLKLLEGIATEAATEATIK